MSQLLRLSPSLYFLVAICLILSILSFLSTGCLRSQPELRNEQLLPSASLSIALLESLSNTDSFIATVRGLYAKYGGEIASFRPHMREWCTKTKSCKFCDFEVEMLYMIIRELKPNKVFEMAPNRGFSSHWILNALSKNDKSTKLYSVDIHNASLSHMHQMFRDRWEFMLGDYEKLLETGQLDMTGFDFIFIDALHTEAFSRVYCQKLLLPHKSRAVVVIHDIVADIYAGGRESAEVYKYIAFSPNIKNVFTVSPFTAPNLLSPVENYVATLNEIRSLHGIVSPCLPFCNNTNHDLLYFETNASPSLFFQLN